MNLSAQTEQLLLDWGDAVLRRQLTDPQFPTLDGGILCPTCTRIHTRIGEMVYPFLRLAKMTGLETYLKAAIQLRKWHQHVLNSDGGIRADNNAADQTSTITGAIALAQSLRFHEMLLDGVTRRAWRMELRKNALYLYDKLSPENLNPNHLAVAAHALALAGTVLAEPRFTRKAHDLALSCLKAFTPANLFISRQMQTSAKETLEVDLAETVCGALPALVLYYRLTQTPDILAPLLKSLETHFQFLLPDGGWDNSWGNKLAYWTYWGHVERGSSLPAFVLMAAENPAFTRFVDAHLNLLRNSTHAQFLYPGLHATPENSTPCVLSLCSQANSLATILDHGFPAAFLAAEKSVSTLAGTPVRAFPEIRTRLVNQNPWRATFTSGGGLSLLWHAQTGLLISASPLHLETEKGRSAAGSVLLTPRLEFVLEGTVYRQIHDSNAQMTETTTEAEIELVLYAKFLNETRQDPPFGAASCKTVYRLSTERFTISINAGRTIPLQTIRFLLPLICSREKVTQSASNVIEIQKSGGLLEITTNVPLNLPANLETRIFNPVPGLAAIPLAIDWPIKQSETLEINFRLKTVKSLEKS